MSPETYDKTIGPKDTATYNWTLMNREINNTYRIEVFKSASESSWTVDLNKDFFILRPGSTSKVVLSVTPPPEMTRGELTVHLSFKITNETDGWNVTVSAVLTKVYLEPKVINFFDNPLPPPLDNKYGVFLLDMLICTLIVIFAYIIFERIIHH